MKLATFFLVCLTAALTFTVSEAGTCGVVWVAADSPESNKNTDVVDQMKDYIAIAQDWECSLGDSSGKRGLRGLCSNTCWIICSDPLAHHVNYCNYMCRNSCNFRERRNTVEEAAETTVRRTQDGLPDGFLDGCIPCSIPMDTFISQMGNIKEMQCYECRTD